MADEKPAAGTPAPDAVEAEYKAELARRVSGAAEELNAEDKPEPEEKPEGETEPDAEEDGEEEATEDEEGDGEEKPEDKGKYSKAFRKLQKEEAGLQQFKATVLAKERDVQAREQKVQAGEQELLGFIKQLRLDPFSTLLKHGILSEDDAEYASKQLYYHSKAAQTDPKNKLEAERLRREREVSLEARSTREEVEKMKRELEAERSATRRDADLNAYVAKFDATVESYKAKNSLLAKAMVQNPARTRRELLQVANDLSAAKQAFADPGLVILAWAKERKAFLAELGVNGAAAPVPQKDKSKSAVEKKGPSDGKSKSQTEAAFDQAAYDKELRERLNGTWAGD